MKTISLKDEQTGRISIKGRHLNKINRLTLDDNWKDNRITTSYEDYLKKDELSGRQTNKKIRH